MPTTIEKACKGNSNAMKALYDINKANVLFLCKVLLLDDNAAASAFVRIFKNMWELLISGQICSEEDFSEKAVQKAAAYCKAYLIKKDSKAFRVPINKNFSGTINDISKMIFAGDVCNIILQNLSPLQRFTYVLSEAFHYNATQLARLLNTSEETICAAFESEKVCLTRIVAAASSKMKMEINLSVEAFHTALLTRKKIEIPKAVDSAVLQGIDTICQPIRQKSKKKALRITTVSSAIILSTCVIVGIAFAVGSRSQNSGMADDNNLSSINSNEISASGDYISPEINISHYADIEIQGYGTITVALDAETAPETVANFVSLAESGFYDGLTFHRIMDGFMMQGGDPNGDGTGGSETNIKGEFSANGFENNLSHVRGAISMARSNDYDSASSQFFIVQEDSLSLDGQYAVFGYVTEGIDIVDVVCETAMPIDDNGLIATDEQPIITSITIRTTDNDTTDTTASESAVSNESF